MSVPSWCVGAKVAAEVVSIGCRSAFLGTVPFCSLSFRQVRFRQGCPKGGKLESKGLVSDVALDAKGEFDDFTLYGSRVCGRNLAGASVCWVRQRCPNGGELESKGLVSDEVLGCI